MVQTIGERLKFVRVSKGMNQTEFGALVGCTRRMISSYECDEADIPNEVMAVVCIKAEVSADFLVLGKDIHTANMKRLITARDNTISTSKTEGGYVVITTKVPVLPELEGL
ncbi:helix-turn-helix transcriptional regulator [bacterium]|nr:helix-turn-helix transcriptional regulator [bacterium]